MANIENAVAADSTAGSSPPSSNLPKSTNVNEENLDEKINAQQEEIEKQIAMEQPLISQLYPINTLLDEYHQDDVLYRKKIVELSSRFKNLRKTRGDGNCFFRAFAFRYFEHLLGKKEEINNLKSVALKHCSDLANLGYNSFTIEDFKDVFIEELEKLADTTNIQVVEQIFNDSGISDYIVVFLRLLVSCHLQMNADFFNCFIEGHMSIKDFCSHEVEPMYRESDHIHIIALTSAINVPVCIVYLDRGNQDKVTEHNFPEESKPFMFILYRPGHYDIIYE